MKVAFDHQIFSLQRYGGISRYVLELASRLPAHNISEVSVVAPLHINEYLTVAPARHFARGRYLPFGGPDISPFIGLVNRLAVPIVVRKMNPDIVHETYYSTKPTVRGRYCIVTVHDMIHELFPEEFADAKQAAAAKRAAVNRADHIICVSENTRRDLVRLCGVDPAKTSVVHLGSSMHADPAPSGVRTVSGRPFLLYLGHRRGYKNFSALLQAYSSSPILREFDLVAFGGSSLTAEERQEIARLNLSESVRFETGSDRKLAAHYQRATAFVYPSKYEGFGIPPLEAMNFGCPVVCSDRASIPEVVGDAGAYFDPDSVEDLRFMLERVISDEALRAVLRARGKARLAAFSWERCAAETAKIYKKLLG